jgi:hypothetical protein
MSCKISLSVDNIASKSLKSVRHNVEWRELIFMQQSFVPLATYRIDPCDGLEEMK